MDLSIVIPVFNEEESLMPLVKELVSVLEHPHREYEVIFVDDGSTDNSQEILQNIKKTLSGIRILRIKKNSGQTAAFDAGFKAAQGEIIITMDGDLQNDPRDIPAMLAVCEHYDLVCGCRAVRHDTLTRRLSSRIANRFRKAFTHDGITDIGCSLKLFKKSAVKKLKLYTGMHRFFPVLIQMEGGRVLEVPVNHRPRKFGTAKYTVRNRIWHALADLWAVCWMKKRMLTYEIEER